MTEKPLVSIITIFLDAEKFLKEAIGSVIAQTYDNWQLLLIDDGSTDGSTAIAQWYAEQYPEKVVYLEHENHQNRGKSISRNLGISNAKGEYIALLDADDVFLPQKLERQVAILNSMPEAAMVYGPTQYWYSWTGNPRDFKRDFVGKLGSHPNTLFNPPELLTLFLRKKGVVPCICGLLVRRKLIIDLGGFEETIQHMYEDQVLLAKICLKAPVFVDSSCWDRYRQHPDSTSYMAIKTGEYHPLKPNLARLTYLHWLAEYVSEQGVKDAELWKTLQRALFPYRYPTLCSLLSAIQYPMRHIKVSRLFPF